MNILDFLNSLVTQESELHNVKDVKERLELVQNSPNLFEQCCGCEKIIYSGLKFCLYCNSYRFDPISQEFANSLTETSNEIDYFIMEK